MKNTTKGVGVRLTRKSYRRKLIMFGFSVFMSLALTATGFAAWIISTNAQADGTVGVNVATINQGNLKVTLDAGLYDEDGDYIGAKLCFGPNAADLGGYLKSTVNNTEDAESGTVSITSSIFFFLLSATISLVALTSASLHLT